MPTRTDKLKSGFFLRTPRADEPPIQYTHTELSRLLIDINSRFAKVNNSIASVTASNGGEDTELEDRVAALEITSSSLSSAIQSVSSRVAVLESDTDDEEFKDSIASIELRLSELEETVTLLSSRLDNPGLFELVAAGEDFLAYTVQEFQFAFDFTTLPSEAKFSSTAVVLSGTTPVPPEITFAGIFVEPLNNVVKVRYVNNTPTDVEWPETKIILHTFF